MTKKDYVMLARVINSELVNGVRNDDEMLLVLNFIMTLSHKLEQDNPAFNYVRFHHACTKE